MFGFVFQNHQVVQNFERNEQLHSEHTRPQFHNKPTSIFEIFKHSQRIPLQFRNPCVAQAPGENEV